MKNRRPPIATISAATSGSGTMSLTGGMKSRDGTKVAFEVAAPARIPPTADSDNPCRQIFLVEEADRSSDLPLAAIDIPAFRCASSKNRAKHLSPHLVRVANHDRIGHRDELRQEHNVT